MKIGSKVRSKSNLSPVQTFSLLMQGIQLNHEYIVTDTRFYLGRNYIKFNESRHWQSEEWFDLMEKPLSGFVIEFD
jgi:hypothetical protein